MSIQSNINQLLSGTAIFSQLPGGQELANKQKWRSDWKKLEKTESDLGLTSLTPEGHHVVNPITTSEQAKNAELVQRQRESLLKRAQEQGGINLSSRAIEGQKRNLEKIGAYQAELNRYSPEKVMTGTKQKLADSVRQKSGFEEWRKTISNVPVSAGGNLSEYPEVIQRVYYDKMKENR